MRGLGLASSGPVWRYLYTHRLENDLFLAGLRAAHFLDEPILWHNSELLDGFGAADYPFSPGEEALSYAMTTYWTNFAKTGELNSAGMPAWPGYSSSDEQVLVLDDPISVDEDWRISQCTLFDSVPDLFPPARLAARFWADMPERTQP